MSATYPWYEIIKDDDDDLQQGNLFDDCPVYVPTFDAIQHGIVDFEWEERDLIVLSQTCDLSRGREKVSEVLLCSVWRQSELTSGHLSTAKGMEDARRGNLPGFHVLAPCELPDMEREIRIVDFRRVYSLPVAFLRRKAITDGRRLRLLPPYREHLSQAFARSFMRVGLPVDIPPFK
jgi:hypothetical protein